MYNLSDEFWRFVNIIRFISLCTSDITFSVSVGYFKIQRQIKGKREDFKDFKAAAGSCFAKASYNWVKEAERKLKGRKVTFSSCEYFETRPQNKEEEVFQGFGSYYRACFCESGNQV